MNIVENEPSVVLDVDVGTTVIIGEVGNGIRRVVPIIGGRATGKIEGQILPGADWQTLYRSGSLDIDAHYAIRTSDNAVIEVQSRGVRTGPSEILARLAAGEEVSPNEYYFRTAIRFFTGDLGLAHLNFRLGVARGRRDANNVHLEVFEVL